MSLRDGCFGVPNMLCERCEKRKAADLLGRVMDTVAVCRWCCTALKLGLSWEAGSWEARLRGVVGKGEK